MKKEIKNRNAYYKAWDEEHSRRLNIKLNLEKENDIVKFLDSLPPGEKARHVKAAIRQYMQKRDL